MTMIKLRHENIWQVALSLYIEGVGIQYLPDQFYLQKSKGKKFKEIKVN